MKINLKHFRENIPSTFKKLLPSASKVIDFQKKKKVIDFLI